MSVAFTVRFRSAVRISFSTSPAVFTVDTVRSPTCRHAPPHTTSHFTSRMHARTHEHARTRTHARTGRGLLQSFAAHAGPRALPLSA